MAQDSCGTVTSLLSLLIYNVWATQLKVTFYVVRVWVLTFLLKMHLNDSLGRAVASAPVETGLPPVSSIFWNAARGILAGKLKSESQAMWKRSLSCSRRLHVVVMGNLQRVIRRDGHALSEFIFKQFYLLGKMNHRRWEGKDPPQASALLGLQTVDEGRNSEVV